jgi:hypothetical protein
LKTFTEWTTSISKEVASFSELLNAPLSDEPHTLADQLRKLEAWSYRMLKLYAESELYLTMARAGSILTCSPDLKALDKEIFIDDSVKIERQYFVMFRGIVGDSHQQGLINRKISLGQTLLKYQEAKLKSLQE